MNAIIKRSTAAMLAMVMILGVFLSTAFSVKVYADESSDEIQNFYYGYNVASGKSLMANDALQSFPIIDPNSDYSKYIMKRSGSTEQQSESFSSTSITEVSNFISKEISGNTYGKIGIVGADINGIFNTSKTVKNCCSVFFDVYTTSITRYNYIVQLNLSEIRQYLSKQFSSEVINIGSVREAKEFLKKFGTHLNTGYSFGGRLVVTNYKSTSDSSIDFSEALSLEAKIAATIKKNNAGLSGSIEEEYGTYENTSESTSTYKFKSYGGEAISSLTLDELFTYNASYTDGSKAGFMYTRWIDSINKDNNLTIIGIPNGAQCIPVWDLLASTAENSQIRQYLIDAYIELCGDKYLEFSNVYPEFVKSVNEDGTVNKKFSLNGVYLKTPGDYFYYVDSDDFSSGGEHNEIHSGDYIYLDLTSTSYDQYDFETQNCEVIDRTQGIFKVVGTSGNVVINCKYPDNDVQTLCRVPIKNCSFEGGTGTEKYPYLIKNGDQFVKISSDLAAHYTLLNDIDFKSKEISVMGDFRGVLDGNYCTISNFTLKVSEDWGLFSANSGTIRNLRIDNAGTSVNNSEFSSGGTKYKEDSFTKNSLSVRNAGIICGQNNGTIDNCYLQNTYIRNVIKNSDKLIVDSSITLSVGSVAGINSGTIANCMVHNSCVLNSFINEKANAYQIYVYSGLLCGLMKQGRVISCVTDTGSTGVVSSSIYNNFKTGSARKGSHAIVYSTAFVGYCDGTATFENCYAYNRGGTAVSSTLDMNFGTLDKQKPSVYRSLSTTALVFNSEADVSTANVNAYGGSSDNDVRAMKPNKNGVNNDKDSFTYASGSEPKINELKIDSETNFNRVCLADGSFSYNPSSTYSSHIQHILAEAGKIDLEADIESTMRTSYFRGDHFSPVGLLVNKKIADGKITVQANAFKLSIVGGGPASADMFSSPLSEVSDGKYSVQIVCNNDKVKSAKINIIVGDVIVTKLNLANQEISYDDKSTFVDGFSFDSTAMSIILSNGTEVLLTPESEYVQNGSIRCQTAASAIGVGENMIHVQYTYNGITVDSSFVLTAVQKEITGIDIVSMPSKTTYKAGETVDTSGLVLNVKYSDGTQHQVSGNDVKDLELIGSTVGCGENEVTVVYADYSKTAKFVVTGEAQKNHEESNSIDTSDVPDTPDTSDPTTPSGSSSHTIGIVIGIVAIVGVISVVIGLLISKKHKSLNQEN